MCRQRQSSNGVSLIYANSTFAPLEQSALKELSERFRPALIGFFCRRVKDPLEAEDLVQEVFLRMIARGEVASIADMRAYLFETASNVLIDRGRRAKVRQRDAHESFDSDIHGGVDFGSERVSIGRETLSRASVALLELPERTRTIFVLRRLEGLKYADIAQRMGISVSAVEKQMMRAVAHLTQRMDDT